MQIEPFGVEQWMNKWETRCDLNLAETCVESLTLAALMQMAGATQQMPYDLAEMKMTYGAIKGSDRLRGLVSALFSDQTPENVLITHGTIGANHLIYHTLIGPGDHVVAITPTYQQHMSIPASIGAEVTQLPLRADQDWLPDWEALENLVQPATKLIALTNPNNPTGAVISKAGLQKLSAIAAEVGAWVLCDEVYRGTEQGDPVPSIADIYAKGISTGSMSKAFSLAGLRLGWLVGPEDLLEHAEIHRDYTTISVGMVDDYFSAMALGVKDQILDRSRRITRENLMLLDDWIMQESRADYVRPGGGTTALVRIDTAQPSYDLCEALIRDAGVMFTPGSVMGQEGYVRVGFANNAQDLEMGLGRVSDWLRSSPS
ncbi:MAG: aminotransferase [Pseudomonadota bacterium]